MGDLRDAVELIKDKFYWMPLARGRTVSSSATTVYFCTDDKFQYEPFNQDFGPLTLGMTWRYCKLVEHQLSSTAHRQTRLVHFCSSDPRDRANTAVLAAAYLVVVLGRSAEEAWAPFAHVQPPFQPYRDASGGRCTYRMTIYDCLQGLAYAMKLGWFDYSNFNIAEYEQYGSVEGGDANWIVPGKFLAFAGPFPSNRDDDNFPVFTPEDYVPIFRTLGIHLVVRLNHVQYDRNRFVDHGVRHMDLIFPDGSCPPKNVIDNFLS
eukprot:CAMPEP_0204361594 /NCGR_PEP_ID=MMETSP0469-20131031/38938_1 /ASSEMBLY_ACC=CAM_ASM_000384 /TAXON_ID=2969 /ORGANISM="Oxyrrhis marina" /LENGTH=262 /DNA_ID=CAMNT_0051350011 /DNA_START=98 /DNA_END=883 /DNA_ORIENTATION=-